MNIDAISEADLVDHYYQHDPDIDRVLRQSPQLQEQFDALCKTLAAVRDDTPDPGPNFGHRMWHRLEQQLPPATSRSRRASWLQFIMPVTAAAAIAVVAFWMGTRVPGVTAPAPVQTATADSNDYLRQQMASHLTEAEQLLTLASHQTTTADQTDWAQAVLNSNRIYRAAAKKAGNQRLVQLLDEMEPMLLQLANQPDATGTPDPSLLFRLRVTNKEINNETI